MKTTRKKLSQEVSDGILEMIRNGEIQLGQRIPIESDLEFTFQVSRTAVREGIKALVAIGVLETRRGIGTFVLDAQVGPLRYYGEAIHAQAKQFLKDLLEFRLIVEPETASLAAKRRSGEDLDELKRCVEALKEHVLNGKNGRPAEDLGFHLALAHASYNSALVDTSSMIARFYENDPYPPDTRDVEEHYAIFERVRNADPDGARKKMQAHLARQKEKYPED